MNIDQLKRAIHIRCTQQFLYFESHKNHQYSNVSRTDKSLFEEDPEDLTIAYAWPEVTSSEVTWLSPLLFPRILPYIFRTFFLVVVQQCWLGCFLRRPHLKKKFSYFFLSSSTKCWLAVFSTTSASYDNRKVPPFYFHIL